MGVLTEEQLQGGFFIGDYEVLPKRHVIRKGEQEESPEPKVFAVLMSLARRNGEDVSRDELIEEVWGGRATADGPINRAISQLRNHFADKTRPYRYVEARHSIGYHLVQPVRLPGADTDTEVRRPGNRVMAAIAAVAVVGLVAMSFWTFLRPAPGAADAIGVQPFLVASEVAEDEYIAAGLKEELLKALVAAGDVTIKSGSVSYPDLPVTKIADRLDVDVVVSGTLRRRGDGLELTWRAENGDDGSLITTDSVSGSKADVLELQRRLVSSVRSGLFPDAEQQLISGSQATGAGTDSYYLGLYAIERRGQPGNLVNAIEYFQTAIRLDPTFGPAYLSLATAYALLPNFEDAPLEQSNQSAIATIEAGIAADGSIADAAGAIYGYVYHRQKRWEEAELAYQRAVTAQIVDSNAFNWYSRMLASVGRLDESLQQVLKAQRIDPDSAIINSRVAIAYTWLGDSVNAAEFFERSRRLQVRGSIHLLANALFLTRSGELEEARQLTTAGLRMQGIDSDWIEPVFAAFGDQSLSGDALAAMNEAAQAEQLPPQIEIVARTMLGDVDDAMRVANLLKLPGEVFEIDLLFVPEMKPLRTHPGFVELLDELGITRYWTARGCRFVDDVVSCESP